MKSIVLFIVCFTSIIVAQSLTLNSPASGFSCRIGDTITVNYTADSIYMSGQKGPLGQGSGGVIIWISVQGKSFAQIHPLNNTTGINSVSITSAFWGQVPIVVPDSTYIIQNDGSLEAFCSVTDSALIKVMDYAHHPITSAANVIKILPAPSEAVSLRYCQNILNPKIVFHNDKLKSAVDFASIRFYNFKGQLIGEYERILKKEISIESIMSVGASVAKCTLVDNTQASMVLIKGF